MRLLKFCFLISLFLVMLLGWLEVNQQKKLNQLKLQNQILLIQIDSLKAENFFKSQQIQQFSLVNDSLLK